jgi:molybdopterin-guanine dinucleotide biosynthesis protein A
MAPSQSRGAIILCGGQSNRMGRDKATLPFGPGEVLLQRVVRLVGEVVPSERIICAATPGQVLPNLPAAVRSVYDQAPGCGPLAGLVAGLKAIGSEVDAVYATGCDVPELVPAFIGRMFELLGDHQIAVPHDGGRYHPLAAVYRTDVLPIVETQLVGDDRSMQSLMNLCRTRRVELDELRNVDPQLASLANCNSPEDYQQALLRRPLPPTA